MIYFPKGRWLMKSSLWSCDRPENIFTDVIRNNKWHHHSPFLLSRHSDDMLNRTAGSSRPEVFCKKGVLRNFIKLTGKRLWQSLFINKVAGLRRSYQLRSYQTSMIIFLTRILNRSLTFSIFVKWKHSTPTYHQTLSKPSALNLLNANPTTWSHTLNNSSVKVDKFFECVWPFWGVGV